MPLWGSSSSTSQLKTYFQPITLDVHGAVRFTGILDIKDYQRVHLEIVQTGNVPNLTVEVNMGKISGSTLAATVGSFPLGGAAAIHTFDVVGPEMSVLVRGPANTALNIQAWLFMH